MREDSEADSQPDIKATVNFQELLMITISSQLEVPIQVYLWCSCYLGALPTNQEIKSRITLVRIPCTEQLCPWNYLWLRDGQQIFEVTWIKIFCEDIFYLVKCQRIYWTFSMTINPFVVTFFFLLKLLNVNLKLVVKSSSRYSIIPTLSVKWKFYCCQVSGIWL